MEYDQYDTPAATYLVWLDGSGVARGCVRVTPTDRPYMIRDNWPEMCETRPLPDSLSEWK
jgi:acyl homoserine lactone synthase